MIKKLFVILVVVAAVGYGSFSIANASVTSSIQHHQHQLATVDSF